MELIFEDYKYSKIVVDIIMDIRLSEVVEKMEFLIETYNGQRRNEFLRHINALFLNILLNDLNLTKERKKIALEARFATILIK